LALERNKWKETVEEAKGLNWAVEPRREIIAYEAW
jgi:hypothetical protein